MFPQVTFRHSDAPSVHELYTLIGSCIVSLSFSSLAYVFLTFHHRPFRIFLSFYLSLPFLVYAYGYDLRSHIEKISREYTYRTISLCADDTDR